MLAERNTYPSTGLNVEGGERKMLWACFYLRVGMTCEYHGCEYPVILYTGSTETIPELILKSTF